MSYQTSENNKECFAVIDTETTWSDKVMSIGIAIADASSFELIDKKYYIITPECRLGGMYSYVLDVNDVKLDLEGSRSDVIRHISDTFKKYDIKSVFAYNAIFDYKHLPEMQSIANPSKYGINGTDETHITEQGITNGDVYEVGTGLTPQDALSVQKYMLKLVSELPE